MLRLPYVKPITIIFISVGIINNKSVFFTCRASAHLTITCEAHDASCFCNWAEYSGEGPDGVQSGNITLSAVQKLVVKRVFLSYQNNKTLQPFIYRSEKRNFLHDKDYWITPEFCELSSCAILRSNCHLNNQDVQTGFQKNKSKFCLLTLMCHSQDKHCIYSPTIIGKAPTMQNCKYVFQSIHDFIIV